MVTYERLLYRTHTHIHTHLSGKNVTISDGAGYYPDLRIGWYIFIFSDTLKKYKVLDMFEEKASLPKFNYSILETGKEKTMFVLYT